jgi:TonB family protein
MTARAWRRPTPGETGLALSLFLHLAVWGAFSWRWHAVVADGAIDPLEIDLTRPFRITDNPALAHKAVNPGAGAPVVEKPTPIAGKGQAGGDESSTEGKGPVQDWKLPVEGAKQVLEKPADAAPAGRSDGVGEGAGLGGLGGTGEGEVDWVYLTDIPRLLNREEVLRDVQRLYPIEERRAGREARVTLDVHINGQGRVVRVDVAESGGRLFDEAARKVLSQARFSPGKAGGRAVSAKIQMPLYFQIVGEDTK